MTRLRNRGDSSKVAGNSFSFIIPFIIAFIILIVIINYIFSSNPVENHTGSFITIKPNQDQSEIYIYMSGDSKKRIDSATKMYITDNKLGVFAGEAEATFENSTSKVFVNKGGEIKYEGIVDGKEVISLENADIFIDSSMQNMKIKLKNFSVTPNIGSIMILSQNTVASNIYVLKGSATVEDYGKKSSPANPGVGQELTIMKSDLSNKTLQFESKITPLTDFIKTNDLFIKHNGDSLLSSLNTATNTGAEDIQVNTSDTPLQKSAKTGIIITSPDDEATLDDNEVTIEGKILNADIVKVTINDKEALINKEEKSFNYKGFPLANASNNIVYKTYNSNGDIISKGILTIYTSKKIGKEDTNKKPSVITYPISDKDFRIINPTENPYKTTDNIVRIEGRINKGIVKYITINDFRLSKFPQLGTSWYYFANKDYGTMNDGINLYTIKYYGQNDELLSTNLFTIVKERKEDELNSMPGNNGSGGVIFQTGSNTES